MDSIVRMEFPTVFPKPGSAMDMMIAQTGVMKTKQCVVNSYATIPHLPNLAEVVCNLKDICRNVCNLLEVMCFKFS